MNAPVKKTEQTLDPDDWAAFRKRAHDMLDVAIDQMESAGTGAVWNPVPSDLKACLTGPLPPMGIGAETDAQIRRLLPHGVGNTHPRFFGWVHGSGTPSNMIAEIAAAAMNANLGGRDHAAIYVERQVVDWCKSLFGFPEHASGLVVSGTSIATLIALKAARDSVSGFAARNDGVSKGLVGYTSAQAHSCVARTFDILGLGTRALRKIPVNAAFEMDISALKAAISRDRAEGYTPFAVIGTAGAVNVGAIDDLEAIGRICAENSLWFHIDGAFGATGILSDVLRPRLRGIRLADSLAFDFHKWLHVNYDAGLVLVRSEEAHRKAFSERPDYLKGAVRGLAACNPWPTEYGPELSRGFRALKIWAQLTEHGPEKLGALISQNCAQAQYLATLVAAEAELELQAPVAMNICCFRFIKAGFDLDRLNDEIVLQLQEKGIAAPSTTMIEGQNAIRVNITNHRTKTSDLDTLVKAVLDIGNALTGAGKFATG